MEKVKKMTQKDKMLYYLKRYGHITKLEALMKLSIWNTGDTILMLRKDHDIETVMVTENGKRFARYYYKGEL